MRNTNTARGPRTRAGHRPRSRRSDTRHSRHDGRAHSRRRQREMDTVSGHAATRHVHSRSAEVWVPEGRPDWCYAAGQLRRAGGLLRRSSRQETRSAKGDGLPGKAWAEARPVVLKAFDGSYFQAHRGRQSRRSDQQPWRSRSLTGRCPEGGAGGAMRRRQPRAPGPSRSGPTIPTASSGWTTAITARPGEFECVSQTHPVSARGQGLPGGGLGLATRRS